MKFARYLILALGFSLATIPISALLIQGQTNLFIWVLAAINLTGWAGALTLGVLRANAGREIDKSFARVGIHSGASSSEVRIREYLYEIERKLSALQMTRLGQSISSREDLSQALERISFHA